MDGGVPRFAEVVLRECPVWGLIHTPKRLRRATVRLGFFRFAAVKEFTLMYGYDGDGKQG